MIVLAASGIPSNPNILTFVERYISSSGWATFLYDWENVIFSLFIASVLSLVFFLGSRHKQIIPGGFQNFLEWVVDMLRSFIIGILGVKKGDIYLPFLGTLFIYALTMNLSGLIPFMASPSSDLNTTIALSICVFVVVQYLNIKNYGIKGFVYHLSGSPAELIGWLLAPFLFVIEFITQVTRPLTLSLRLFGNILGEKILVSSFTTIGATLLYFIPIQLPFMFLGILIGLIQAMVFALLATIYILLASPHGDEKTQTT